MSGSIGRPDWAADIADLARRIGILERRTTPAPTPAGPLVPAAGEDSGWVLPANLKIIGLLIVDGTALIPILSGDVTVSGDLTVYDQLQVNGAGENIFGGSIQINGALNVDGYVFAGGFVVVDPDGGWWRIVVDHTRALSTEDVGP